MRIRPASRVTAQAARSASAGFRVRRAIARASGSCASRAVTANSSAVLSTQLLAAGARAGGDGRRTAERDRAAEETGAVVRAGDRTGTGAMTGASLGAPAHAETAAASATRQGLTR